MERRQTRRISWIHELADYFNGTLDRSMGERAQLYAEASSGSRTRPSGPSGPATKAAWTCTVIMRTLGMLTPRQQQALQACYRRHAPSVELDGRAGAAAGWLRILKMNAAEKRQGLCGKRKRYKRGSEAFKSAQAAVTAHDDALFDEARETVWEAQGDYLAAKKQINATFAFEVAKRARPQRERPAPKKRTPDDRRAAREGQHTRASFAAE